jgi:eukaryotic-like serine/threonine-protein kinase
MGEVYRAHDPRLDRDVAIKILPQAALADRSNRKRLRKEAQALSRLNHPNIETLFEFNSEGDVEFLVVEYIPGTTLSEILDKDPMPEKEIARLGVQLAAGMAAAHAENVVHRDLKPDNLRITPDGRLKILDFGIAKLLKPARESPGTDSTTDSASADQNVIGTLPYMTPEQLKSEPTDSRSDIYSAGAVLYEMATSQRPFRETSAPRLVDAILHQPIVAPRARNSRISPELERIIIKCLEKEPENRYPSARDLEVDLRQLAVPRTTGPIQTSSPSRWWRQAAGTAVVLVLLGTVGLVALRYRAWQKPPASTPDEGRVQSVAVLPMKNLSGDPKQEFFADGMTDQLIADLSQIKALRVISRTSMMQYKDTRKPLPEIAKELNADAVIESSVLRVGDRVRITADLIQGTTDKHLWTDTYERESRDILKLQNDVAGAIANGIKIVVTPQERERLTSAPAVDPAAYEANLQGRFYWNKGTERDNRVARQYFERAAQIDPNYAAAYTGLADYYWQTDALPPSEKLHKAKQFALKALAIDPNLSAAHASLGAIYFFGDWNWTGAVEEYKRALELDPGNMQAHRLYSDYLSEMGKPTEALEEIRKTQELDPLSTFTKVSVGWALYFARRYDQASEQCGKVAAADPHSVGAHDCLGLSYLAQKKFAKAIEECKLAVNLSGNDLARAVDLAQAYALAGDRAAAYKLVDEWRVRARRTYVSPTFFARVYFALGENKLGFVELERAFTQRDLFLTVLPVDPAFDSVRTDPHFRDLLALLHRNP